MVQVAPIAPTSAPAGAASPAKTSVTAEEAQDYLTRLNFKSLIEWITAETILTRPDDPVKFVKALIDKKLVERAGQPFKPQDATDYIKQCYAEASASADENGRIQVKSAPAEIHSARGEGSDPKTRLGYLDDCIKICRLLAMQTSPKEASTMLIQESCRILDAERVTIYYLNEATNELILHAAEGASGLRVKVGHSIAGMVAETGKTVNLKDVQKDQRHDRSYDEQTGFVTRSMLVAPITEGRGHVIGVLQALNHQGDKNFSEADEEIAVILAAQAGISIKNAQMLEQAQKNQAKVQYILEVIQAIQSEVLGPTSLMFTIQQRAPMLVDADRCTLFLVDRKANCLISFVGDVNIQIPLNEGLAGAVATSGEVINIDDCYADKRFNKEIDKSTGYQTRNMLTMPIHGSDKSIIGVIQLINKLSSAQFDSDDQRIMTIFLKSIGVILQHASVVSSEKSQGTEANGKPLAAPAKPVHVEASIQEEEESEGTDAT